MSLVDLYQIMFNLGRIFCFVIVMACCVRLWYLRWQQSKETVGGTYYIQDKIEQTESILNMSFIGLVYFAVPYLYALIHFSQTINAR
jgi:hypothetical protein